MAFSIRIATLDSDGNLELDFLKARGKVVNDWNLEKLRRMAERELNKRGFGGISCWANKDAGRRFEWTAEEWPVRLLAPGITKLDMRKRGSRYIVADIIL